MLWETGCRVGELLKLQYSNIIFLKEDDDFGAQIIFPSSDTKNREEKISFVKKELAELIKSFKSKTNENRVFASRYYTPFNEVKELAGLTEPDARYGETIVFHHFRHSFATYPPPPTPPPPPPPPPSSRRCLTRNNSKMPLAGKASQWRLSTSTLQKSR